jgi:hypothetical protein
VEEHFIVFIKGPGLPFKIEVNKIWIENDKVYFNIVGLSSQAKIPRKLFEHVSENIFRCNASDVDDWILRQKEVVKIKVSERKEIVYKAREELLKDADIEDVKVEELIKEMDNVLIQIKTSLDQLINSGGKKLKQKALRSFTFFTARLKEELLYVKIPLTINKFNLNYFSDSLSKLLNTIDFISRKTLSDFSREVHSEVAELNFLIQKLEKKDLILKKKLE